MPENLTPEQKPSVSIGIDVAKATLEVASFPAGLTLSLENSAKGHKELLRTLKSYSVERIVLEATGGYERKAASEMLSAGYQVVVANPRQVRDFAKGLGILAKTDRIDAFVIARFADVVKPKPRPRPSSSHEELSALVGRRSQLVDMKAQEDCRLPQAADKRARKSIEKVQKVLKAQIDHLDSLIAKAIQADEELCHKDDLLQSAKGIGPATSAMLLSRLPELGSLTRWQVASLVGVAPWDVQSGFWQGTRRIWGGRSEVRKALYMATVTAITHNPVISEFARRHTAAGKKPKVMIVACMHKLLTILNAMLAKDTKWQS